MNKYELFQPFSVKSIDREKRRVRALASTGDLDRDGEVILPTAFEKTLEKYLENPVILAGHKHRLEDGRSPVVGKTVNAWIDKQGLWIIVEFAPTPLGLEYWELYGNGYQRAFSIGFRGIQWSDQKRDGKQIRIWQEVELMEISCVAVPANPAALVKGRSSFVDRKRAERAAAEIHREYGRMADLYLREERGDRLSAMEVLALEHDRLEYERIFMATDEELLEMGIPIVDPDEDLSILESVQGADFPRGDIVREDFGKYF